MGASKFSQDHDSLAELPSGDALLKRDLIIGGRYRVVSLLGKGGMGSVYGVQDLFENLEFALKTLDIHRVSEIAVRRFQIETRTAALLDHPNLVRMQDFGLIENGQPYMVMEFVDGITLTQHLREQGSMSVEQAAPLFAQVCCGLHYAHEQGVIHRDIKPSNIMLVKNAVGGSEGSVKVVDFGIARLANDIEGAGQALTHTGDVFGSPLYMSPEQCSGEKVDHRSDIYSLGCVLFEVLTGAPPHIGQSVLATMMMHKSQPAPSLREASLGKEFPEALEQVVARMLCKSPDDRYQNLGAVAHQLASVCRGSAAAAIHITTQNPVKISRTVSLSPGRLYTLLAITAVCAAALSVLSLKIFEQCYRSNPPVSAAKLLPGIANSRTSRTLTSDTELLDGFTEVEQSKLPSVDSIKNVMQVEDSKSKQIIFPERAIGTLWAFHKGVRISPSFGEAKGAISIPSGVPIALEVNDAALRHPAILDEADLSLIDGLIFNDSAQLQSDKYLESMKRILLQASQWKNLQFLALLRCPADSRTIDSLSRLKNLQHLELVNVAGLDDSALSMQPILRQLKTVGISGTHVDRTVQKIAGTPNLESIFLTNTGVSPDTVKQLARCPELKLMSIVDVRENKLDDRMIDAVIRMERLRSVAFFHMNGQQVARLSHRPQLKDIQLYDAAYSPAQKDLIKSLDARVKFMQ